MNNTVKTGTFRQHNKIQGQGKKWLELTFLFKKKILFS